MEGRSPPARQDVDEAVPGYPSGPGSSPRATEAAVARLDGACWALIVEGVSDQIAVETMAARLGRDLPSEGVVVVPIGGAQAVGAFVAEQREASPGLKLAGLCDEAEEGMFRRALEGTTGREADALFVCRSDLEEELIRALPRHRIEAVLAGQGDLRSFRTMQRQPDWRERGFPAQMRRFMGAGARRKARYARLLAEAIDLPSLPPPISGLLARIGPC